MNRSMGIFETFTYIAMFLCIVMCVTFTISTISDFFDDQKCVEWCEAQAPKTESVEDYKSCFERCE